MPWRLSLAEEENVTGNTTDITNQFRPQTVYLYLNISMSVILLLTIVFGNGLILYLVVKHRGLPMTAVRNILIGAMALHDLVTGFTLTPLHIVNVLQLDNLTEMACLASNTVTFTIHIVSGYAPLLLALERFIAIVYPFAHPVLVTEKRVCVFLGAIWLYGMCVGCMPLLGWNNVQSPTSIVMYCHVELFVDGRYLGFIYMCNVVPCMIGQVILYLKILHTALLQAKRVSLEQKHSMNTLPSGQYKSDRRGLVILCLTSVFFILSYLPVIIETAIDFRFYTTKALEHTMLSSILFSLGDVTILANSALNPLLYAYSNKDFRIKIKSILRNLSCK